MTGILPGACYAAGMTSFLNANHIRIFDQARFAEPLRHRFRETAPALATEQGAQIEPVGQAHVCKEEGVAKVIQVRGDHPGLVPVLSAMEACNAYEPWHDPRTPPTFLRPASGKCLHDHFYWIHETHGLVYLRGPTGSPFRLQFYGNGHRGLARSLTAAGVDDAMADNAFIGIDDGARVQPLADGWSPDTRHRILDGDAQPCGPIRDVFGQTDHGSLMQVEYSTDRLFRSDAIVQSLDEELSRPVICCVKAEQVASFLDKPRSPQLAQEIGSRLATRIEGTCIKHHWGKASIKMYDTFNRVLRLETTTHDVSFFKDHRKFDALLAGCLGVPGHSLSLAPAPVRPDQESRPPLPP